MRLSIFLWLGEGGVYEGKTNEYKVNYRVLILILVQKNLIPLNGFSRDPIAHVSWWLQVSRSLPSWLENGFWAAPASWPWSTDHYLSLWAASRWEKWVLVSVLGRWNLLQQIPAHRKYPHKVQSQPQTQLPCRVKPPFNLRGRTERSRLFPLGFRLCCLWKYIHVCCWKWCVREQELQLFPVRIKSHIYCSHQQGGKRWCPVVNWGPTFSICRSLFSSCLEWRLVLDLVLTGSGCG